MEDILKLPHHHANLKSDLQNMKLLFFNNFTEKLVENTCQQVISQFEKLLSFYLN